MEDDKTDIKTNNKVDVNDSTFIHYLANNINNVCQIVSVDPAPRFHLLHLIFMSFFAFYENRSHRYLI